MANTTISTGAGSATLAGVAASLFAQTTSAKLYVSEFPANFSDSRSGSDWPRCPPLRSYAVPYSASASVLGLQFLANTAIVRLHSDGVASLAFGGQGLTATAGLTNSMRLAAGVSEYFAVQGGSYLAVIAAS